MSFKVIAHWPDGQVFERLISFEERVAADQYVEREMVREQRLAKSWNCEPVQFEVREEND